MKQLLENIADVVTEKVRLLPESFGGHEEVGMGASGSATSKIDKFAEDIIIDLIKDEKVRLNILSEEAGFIDFKGEKTLVIDPVDGTANYHARIPFYSVSLAIGKNKLSDITHGLVKNIVSGETYYAEKGKGAWLNGKKIQTRHFKRGESLFLSYVGNSTDPITWKVVEVPRRVRSLGCASLEMCHVARGKADGYYFNCMDYKKCMRIVDIAASALVLREAGGEVYDLQGQALDMNFNLDERVNFLALGDKSTKEMIM